MKKMKTLFEKDPNNLSRVLPVLQEEFVDLIFNQECYAERKLDGSACMVKKGVLYKRYDVKKNKKTGEWKPIPEGAISCQDPDGITGHWPHWVKCDRNCPSDKWHWVAYDANDFGVQDIEKPEKTYELVGPNINGNRDAFASHMLYPHSYEPNTILFYSTFCGMIINALKWSSSVVDRDRRLHAILTEWLKDYDIEGLVFYTPDSPLPICRLRKKDMGLKRV